MPNPLDITNIPAPRVDFIDPRTGLMAREWYRFFFNLFNLTGGGANDTSLSDLQVGPPPINSVLGEINASFDQSQLAAMSDQAEAVLGQLGLVYDQAQLASMIAQYEQATLNLQNQFDTLPSRPELGTIASYNLNGSPVAGGVGYGTGSAVAFTPAGTSGQFLTSAAAGTPTWASPSSVAVTSFSAGTTGLTPATATTGAVTLAGTLAVANGGTGVTSSTGSGSIVLSTSPTLITPLLGTPTSGDFSTGTFTWPTFNQNTTGSAAKWTTARNLAGNSVDGSANVAFANKFVVQGTTDTGLSGAQFLGALGTGIVKNTTTTGVLSIAVAADFPTLNQNTTGTAANVTGVVAVANGGTGASTASITSFNNITGYAATGTTGTTSTNLVFSGSPTIATPTFTTSATFPLHIGGTGTTSTLSLRSTSGVGAAGADIIFQTGNNGATEAMRVLNSGNVGIGTNAPSALLHIANGNATQIIENTAAAGNATLQLKYPSRTWSIATRGADLSGALVIRDTTAGADRILVDSSGNVGIAVTSPSYRIDIDTSNAGGSIWRGTRGTSQLGAYQLNNSTGYLGMISNHSLAIVTNDTERLRIDSTGNVGIGTTAPSSPLTVYAANNQATIKVTNGPSANNVGITLESLGGNVVLNNGNGPLELSVGGAIRAVVSTTGNVGIGTSTNLSTLTVNGSFASKSPSTVNAATYSVAATDGSLRFTTTNNTLTLPSAASFPGRILYLNTITANSVTSASSNVIPLGSNTAGTAILAATAGKFAMLQSDGTNWITMLAN